ncbi:hypothetical protein ACI78V_09250 [Geodermatophilus sp. SYSU D00742]
MTAYQIPPEATRTPAADEGSDWGIDEASCGLPCLARPRFYCGMVLTDDHLNDLARWVRQRLSLHRFVEGWGVAQGLEVGQRRADPSSTGQRRADPSSTGQRRGELPSVLVVGPGYARSCCGDDIVVCDQLTVDVCSVWADPVCADPGQPDGEAADGTERRVVDLLLLPAAMPVDPTWVRSACECGEHNGPEHERVVEGGVLQLVDVADSRTDPATLAAQHWRDGLRSCAQVLSEYAAAFSEAPIPEEFRRWLLGWIDRQDADLLPLLAGIRDRVRARGIGDASPVTVLAQLVRELRNHHLTTTFAACDTASGVRLARVWASRSDDGTCAVDCVDARPPFRHVLTAPGWPSPPGEVSLSSALWQRWDVAQDLLLGLGLQVTGQAEDLPADATSLREALADEVVSAVRGSAVEAVLHVDPCGPDDPDDAHRRVAWLRRPTPRAAATGPAPRTSSRRKEPAT